MKKSYIQYVVFGILLVTLLVFNNYSNNSTRKNIQENHTDFHNDKNIVTNFYENDMEKFYFVKENNNEIFLYDNNMNMIKKLDIDFSGLREYDKKIFVSGIRFNNMDDVYCLIEDFSN